MANERRYGEEEVEEIFDRAAESRGAEGRALESGGGLSLEELQAIGSEVGLLPERIAEAASAIDLRRGALPRQRSLGMPISVGRVLELPRALTDREWDLLVTELRQTFKARGNPGVSGGVRHWANGHLHAYVEPTEAGYRLRLGTLKGNAKPLNRVGVMGLSVAIFLAAALLLTGTVGEDLVLPLMFGGLGIGILAANALSLPGWARKREEQMEYIVNRVEGLLSQPAEGGTLG
jgi:hypothetical protein